MSENNQQELRNCPYCQVDESQIDSAMHFNEAQNKYFHFIVCNACELCGPPKETEQEAVEAWNSLPRPSPWIPKECDCGSRTYECVECGKFYHSDTPSADGGKDE